MPTTIQHNKAMNTVYVFTDDPNLYIPSECILPFLCKSQRLIVNGEKVKSNTPLFRMFVEKGINCVCCGCSGEVFQLRHDKKTRHPYLTLYALVPTKWSGNFKKVPFTKDHIWPKSLKGKDTLSNFQSMCAKCNNEKGNSLRDVKPEWA